MDTLQRELAISRPTKPSSLTRPQQQVQQRRQRRAGFQEAPSAHFIPPSCVSGLVLPCKRREPGRRRCKDASDRLSVHSNLAHLLRDHYEAFTVTAYAVKNAPTNKGGLQGAFAIPRTSLGVEAFNAARRPSKSIFHRVYSSRSLYSSASSSSSNLSSAAPSSYGSEAEDDDTVRPAQGRSRSSTSTSLLVGDAAIEAQERLRAAAGAGGNSGLGRGLLRCAETAMPGLEAFADPS